METKENKIQSANKTVLATDAAEALVKAAKANGITVEEMATFCIEYAKIIKP